MRSAIDMAPGPGFAFSVRELLHEEPALVEERLPPPEPCEPEAPALAGRRRAHEERVREDRERARLAAGAVPAAEAPAPADDEGEEELPPDGDGGEDGEEEEGAGRRPRREVSGKTVDLKRVSARERHRLQLLHPPETYWRPGRRGDCEGVPRPCPYVGCKWHLLLDATEVGTSIKVNFPDLLEDRVHHGPVRQDGAFFADGGDRVEEGPFLKEMEETCALDVAARRGATHEAIGPLMNLSRERIRQIEEAMLAALRARHDTRALAHELDLKLEELGGDEGAVETEAAPSELSQPAAPPQLPPPPPADLAIRAAEPTTIPLIADGAPVHYGEEGSLAPCRAWIGKGGSLGTADRSAVTCKVCLPKLELGKVEPPGAPPRRLPVMQRTLSSAFVVYRGSSAFNGAEILAIVTGATGASRVVKGSKNVKTGPMAQLYILVAGEAPFMAQKSGADAAVCGDCRLRHGTAQGLLCYVETRKGPRSTWNAHADAPVRLDECLATLRRSGADLRLGAYGDPAALPREVVEELAGAAVAHTGYTHDWKNERSAWLRPLVMASCETADEAVRARALGWRPFRIVEALDAPLLEGEVFCPAATHGTLCIDCRLCDGAHTGDGRKSVAIPAHGRQRRPLAGQFFPPSTPAGVPMAAPEPRFAKTSVAATPTTLRPRLSYKTITPEEELGLVERCKGGDRAAGDALLELHAGLLIRWAKHYSGKGVDFDDLHQEARIGFISKGVPMFDQSFGVKFSIYAATWMRSRAARYLANNHGVVRVPVHLQEKKAGKEAIETSRRAQRNHSLDAPVGDESGATFLDMTAGEDNPEQAVTEVEEATFTRTSIAEALEHLTLRERDVIQRTILAGEDEKETLEAVGASMGIGKERIRQIQQKALIKLRRTLHHLDDGTRTRRERSTDDAARLPVQDGSRGRAGRDLTGKLFGKLTALRPALEAPRVRGRISWVCSCACGTRECLVNAYVLLHTRTPSCGCVPSRKGGRQPKGQRVEILVPAG